MLKGVFVGGCWLEEPSRVKEETRQFFKRRFEEVEWERPRLDGVRFKSIGQQDNDLLVACFEEEEVRAAWNTADVHFGSAVAVFGLGAVGLSVSESFGYCSFIRCN